MNTSQLLKKIVITPTILTFMLCHNVHASSYQEVYDVVFKTNDAKTTQQQTEQVTESSIEGSIEQPSEAIGEVTSEIVIEESVDPSLTAMIATEKAVYASGKLPAYRVSVFKFGKSLKQRLANRTTQTLIDEFDYYDRLEKIVHSNGICMSGTWQINESATNASNQAYTGMFAKGASSLFIGRLSVALSETKQGQPQAFSMAGKIFGTNDVNQSVTTESFFVGDVLSGIKRDSVYSAPMTTKPQVKFRLAIIPLAFRIGGLFSNADKNAGMRPVTGIARMGATSDDVVSPKYMQIMPVQPQDFTQTQGIDFRDEFALSTTEQANNVARSFTISVSDIAEYDNNTVENNDWQEIGTITATETLVSYGCDRQLHFSHPKSDD